MSTEFVSNTTGEIAFLRYAGGHPDGPSFDFGSITNLENVLTALGAGETFRPHGGGTLPTDPEQTVTGFAAMVISGRATFGVMPFTLELGSGDIMRIFTEL